jgi:hypothetical protein
MRPAILLAVSSLALLAPRPASAQPAPLSAYWPHEDGRTWFYDQHFENLALGTTVDSQARLWFDGTTVAPLGIAAQVLTGSVTTPPGAPATQAPAIPAEVNSPLLRHLWLARPDLRPRLLEPAGGEPCPRNAIEGWEPLLLTGGLAYAQTASEVAAWRCDRSNTRSWLWLTSELAPGSTASIPLVPDLADDVILRLTVLGLEDVTVPGGTFPDCLHVDYLVDYGESECTDASGSSLGTFRAETRGFVRYAPGVGPIESYEEFQYVSLTGSCPLSGLPRSRASLRLNAPSVPAQASSWGRLKSVYHH